ncbi:unnamed protein product [Ilex paraguariensis]|uniref:ULTRAPETALA1/2 zinc finger domain-containing protein n=1 Tax=Ilex paraguariensis TaxID=185542 RepID=A0ABC8UPR3_9AQUA
MRGLTVHRDEFINCSRCDKERRFSLRSNEQCRIYHDALANKNWTCSDMPNDQMTCEDVEERKSRKACRGCPENAACKGCIRCVCFGCSMCRFPDCTCRTCVDFIQNANPDN